MEYHFVYKTTNLINSRFYIGKHSTDNLDDGYMGSGKLIWPALGKYGRKNFKREIIKFFNSEKEAYEFEKQVLTEDILNNPKCYNLVLGGVGYNTDYVVIFNDGCYKAIKQEDYDKNIHKAVGSGKTTVIDSQGNQKFVSTELYRNDPSLKSVFSGKVQALDSNGKVVMVTKEEFDSKNLKGTNSKKKKTYLHKQRRCDKDVSYH